MAYLEQTGALGGGPPSCGALPDVHWLLPGEGPFCKPPGLRIKCSRAPTSHTLPFMPGAHLACLPPPRLPFPPSLHDCLCHPARRGCTAHTGCQAAIQKMRASPEASPAREICSPRRAASSSTSPAPTSPQGLRPLALWQRPLHPSCQLEAGVSKATQVSGQAAGQRGHVPGPRELPPSTGSRAL